MEYEGGVENCLKCFHNENTYLIYKCLVVVGGVGVGLCINELVSLCTCIEVYF